MERLCAMPHVNTAISVDESSIIRSVPTDFAGLGLNFNVSYYTDIILLMESSPLYPQMLLNLGQSNIRIEGGDYGLWQPDTNFPSWPYTGTHYYNKEFVDRVYGIFNSTGWSVTWLINFQQYDSAKFASTYGYMFWDMAGYIWTKFGSKLKGIEIGNEPNAYPDYDIRPSTWTYSDFLLEWDVYEAAIHGVSPSIPICAPQVGDETWIHDFSVDRPTKTAFLNQHKYPTSKTGSGFLSPTIENIFSRRLRKDVYASLQVTAGYANAASLPITMGETNCVGQGGKDGVSNTFIASIWGVDYLFTNLLAGFARVNFHGCFEQTTYYQPILADGTAGPLYYSLLLFHYAAPDGNLVTTTTTPFNTINTEGYSVVRNDGSLAVVVINKDLNSDVDVQITTQNTYTQATVVYMTAPSFTSKTGITFAGSSVASDGTWSVSTSENVEIVGKDAWVKVPVLNAAVVVFS